jgi:PQ loop repeat
VTVFIISTSVIEPGASDRLPPLVLSWGGFMGTSAAACAVVQYAPQIINTYRTKLVGALSIPMMLIQTPGGVLMVTSIALRPGTNWTSKRFFHDSIAPDI